MPVDCRGLAVTTDQPLAIAQLDAATHAFLAQRPDARSLLRAGLAADPALVVGHVFDGFCDLLAARQPARAAARSALIRARQGLAARGGTGREWRLTDALAAWALDGDMARCADLLDATEPRDLLALRLGHAVRFMLGDAGGMRRALEVALPAWSEDMPGHGYVLGCHAFTLGETGELARAEMAGRAAVARCPDDLWGGHAVAHALGGQRRAREAVAWIGWMQPHMACGGAFVRHLHWHRALGHLALGEGDAALGIYRTVIHPAGVDEVRDLLNAASLLWRLQDAGQPVTRAMWDELAEVAEQRVGEHAWVFADLHYALCLAGGGRMQALAGLLASMRGHAATGTGSQARIAAQVGLPVAGAIAAAGAGQHDRAAALLRPVATAFARLGGSTAQRALLHRIHARAEEASARQAG